MFYDLKLAIRSLRKTPLFTGVAVLILALCVGANTATFTILKKVVLDPLPFPDSDRLITFHNDYPGIGIRRIGNSIPDYLDRKQLTDVFDSVAVWSGTGFEIGAAGAPHRVPAELVTPDYFDVLGTPPLLGRVFSAENATPGQDKVVVLSHAIWQELFAGDRNILGKDIRLSDVPYRVIGIMPPFFQGAMHEQSQLWVPLVLDSTSKSDNLRHLNPWQMIGRLRPGVSLAHARQRIDALNHTNLERFPVYRKLAEAAHFGTLVADMKEDFVGNWTSTLFILQAAAALVLLIGCVNVATLMLVRSTVRIKELSIRVILGASRGHLARQLLTESIVLAAVGGLVGLVVAFIGIRLLGYLGADEIPRGAGASLDAAVLGFNSGAVIVTSLIFSSVPFYNLWRYGPAAAVHSAERAGTSGSSTLRTRSVLVVGQISLAFILLVGSALLALSFDRLLRVSPGFRAEGVATAQITLPPARYNDDSRARSFIAGLLDRLQATPGVRYAGVVAHLPFSIDYGPGIVVLVGGRQPAPGEKPPAPHPTVASPAYFEAMGIPLLEGRTIADRDDAGAPLVVVIDEFLARKYWPKGNALGAKLGLGLSGSPMLTVVGVVGSVKAQSLSEHDQTGHIYSSYKQFPARVVRLVVRGTVRETALFNIMRQAVAQLDPELPVTDMRTMSERVSRSLAQARAAMTLCLIFGGLATVLAAIGIYGVLAYSVTQRTREFGIRLALGAQSGNLLAAVTWQGLKMAGCGLGVGGLGALGLTRFLHDLLYEVAPGDPLTFSVVAALMAGVAWLACYIPARRVIRVDPLVALRAE